MARTRRCPRCGGGPGDPSCGKTIHTEIDAQAQEQTEANIARWQAAEAADNPEQGHADAETIRLLEQAAGALPANAAGDRPAEAIAEEIATIRAEYPDEADE
jgi:hypothetical protein